MNKTGTNKVDDYDVHIRSGFIVPMVDVTRVEENNQVEVMNTHDLQEKPIDLHIHPHCVQNQCYAQGRFLNDDGKVLNITNK